MRDLVGGRGGYIEGGIWGVEEGGMWRVEINVYMCVGGRVEVDNDGSVEEGGMWAVEV